MGNDAFLGLRLLVARPQARYDFVNGDCGGESEEQSPPKSSISDFEVVYSDSTPFAA